MKRSAKRHVAFLSRQHGVSIVELMVGVAVGLVVIAGALSLFSTSVQNTRRSVAESRVQQDLRSIADTVTREIRRAGYWAHAAQGVLATGAATTKTTANAYSGIIAVKSDAAGSIEYGYAIDANDSLDDGEKFGFSLADGVLKMQTEKGEMYPLNDVGYTKVTELSVNPATEVAIWLGDHCESIKFPGPGRVPYVYVRRYDLKITAESVLDSTIKRTFETKVKVRNHRLDGDCDA